MIFLMPGLSFGLKDTQFKLFSRKAACMRTLEHVLSAHRQVLDASQKRLAPIFSAAVTICTRALNSGKKIMICGNGGSAADAQHFAAELVGRYQKDRRGWPALALTADSSVITAISNDFGYEQCFARQIEALGQAGDVLIAISTSGNSKNIIEAAKVAKQSAITVIILTGDETGKLDPYSDVVFAVPSKATPRIQEMHGILLHALVEMIEHHLIVEDGR
jgi:D-sedoheptulose 7-phosphate isomerase